MSRILHSNRRSNSARRFAVVVALICAAAALACTADVLAGAAAALAAQSKTAKSSDDRPRIRLTPHFAVGQIMDYQIEMKNVTKGRATGVVQDPEAASELTQSTSLQVRLEVLNMETPAAAEAPKVRIRATCRHAAVTNESDAYDEQAEAMAEQYRKLEGRSLEFGLDADGHVSDVRGLEGVVQDPSALASVRGWLTNISAGSRFPKRGIAIGDKWHSEEPVPGAPLKETVWRSDSTYLRNQPCRAASGGETSTASANAATSAGAAATNFGPDTTSAAQGAANPAGSAVSPDDQESCAVILTQFKILQANPHGDLTPADYLHNGLRTSGTWTGSGESTNLVSLETGLVVSATQTVEQHLNFTIASASSASRLNYTGNVKSQSEITLLPPHGGGDANSSQNPGAAPESR